MEQSRPPLAWLSDACTKCLLQRVQADCEPCRELAYRALCDGNDAAWDLLVVHLWPLILRWLYANDPELMPTTAEAHGYRLLWRFRRHYTDRPDLAADFPSFHELLKSLQRYLLQMNPPRGG